MSNSSKYEMTINLSILNHLGFNLYSNVPPVLSEVVANSWDADATVVDIQVEKNEITITDNGMGMDLDDINKKYLFVGYERRKGKAGELTPKGRRVMGRKGIGKLSLFSIANIVRVETIKEAEKNKKAEKHGLVMSVKSIEEHINEEKPGPYKPDPLSEDDITLDKKGTRIVLTGLQRRVTQSSATALQKRLARRFSVIGTDDFNVIINGKTVTVTDRDYFHKIQYLWFYGKDSEKYRDLCKLEQPNKDAQERPGVVEVKDENYFDPVSYPVKGWIGTVHKAGDLSDKDGDDNLNKIVIMVRGKLAQEDILEDFTEGGLYTKYLIGEIHADFLDLDDKDDIATSNRQEIIKDDPRYQALQDWVKEELKNIKNLWTAQRNEEGERDARRIPAIDKWLDSLKGDRKKHAQALLGKIRELPLDEDKRINLYKYSVLAFESLMYKDRLSSLENLTPENIHEVTKVFADLAEIEASHYYQIVSERLSVIEALYRMVEENAIEKMIQDYLPEHFWLLDPSWERAGDSLFVERSVTTTFDEINDNLSNDERNGRIDIRYKKMAGQHVIIELKRPGLKTNDYELLEQVGKYRTALQKQLDLIGAGDDTIEIVCIVGEELRQWTSPRERARSKDILAGGDIRVLLYHELINDAIQIYKDFLQKRGEAGRLCELINSIEVNALN